MFIPGYRKHSGFTMIEIIIIITVLGVICSVIFSMHSGNTNVFQNSTSQFNAQSNARIALDYIIKETKYATDMSIIDVSTCMDEITNKTLYNGKNYNYIYIQNGSLNQAVYDGSQYAAKTILSAISNSGTSFTKIDDSTLGINITCKDGTKTFSTTSNVILSNFALISPVPTLQGGPDLAIRYITTLP